MKKIIFGLLLCHMVGTSKSQSLKQLNIGDTLPAINVDYINGDRVESRSLASFYKDNFLIIDFWANWCGACINAMAAADSVSKEFNSALKILPITYQDANTVGNFVKNNEMIKKLNLDYIVNDTVLMGGYFKFVTLPHEIWIDKEGIIRAITYADEITTEAVKKFLNNQPLLLPQKIDDITFDFTKPLKIENDSFIYRSVLTHYKTGLPNSIVTLTPLYIKNIRINRFTAVNRDILSLFYAAYSQSAPNLFMNRIELHIKDTIGFSTFLKYKYPDRKLMEHNSYCYELILPEKVSKELFYTYLLDDLNRLFKYKASIEKRKKACWIIINKNKSLNPSTKGMPSKMTWEKGFMKSLRNETMDVLTSYLNWEMDSIPVIDETNYKKSFDLELNAVLGRVRYLDSEKIKATLNKYGFDLQKATRMVDILVIKEIKKE